MGPCLHFLGLSGNFWGLSQVQKTFLRPIYVDLLTSILEFQPSFLVLDSAPFGPFLRPVFGTFGLFVGAYRADVGLGVRLKKVFAAYCGLSNLVLEIEP